MIYARKILIDFIITYYDNDYYPRSHLGRTKLIYSFNKIQEMKEFTQSDEYMSIRNTINRFKSHVTIITYKGDNFDEIPIVRKQENIIEKIKYNYFISFNDQL